MLRRDEIDAAKHSIERLFLEQCRDGAQTKELAEGLVACGQFLGSGALTSNQRGLHGTAAALYVLAHAPGPEVRGLIQGLVRYIEGCFGLLQVEDMEVGTHRSPDTYNVIKISEVLYALRFVEPAAADTEQLRKALVDHLLNSKVNNEGWGYWTTGNTPTHIIPTAYAVRSLGMFGYKEEVADPVRHLWTRLLRKEPEREASDPMVRTLALYVLMAYRGPRPAGLVIEPRSVFEGIWAQLGSLMASDIEQNIEYQGAADRRNDYVRIPWQLYLSAVAAQLGHATFASTNVQDRLRTIITTINTPGGGFRYLHSGNLISARTNAIVHEVLRAIEPNLRNTFKFRIYHYWDRFWTQVSRVLNARWVKVIAAVVAGVLASGALVEWHRDPNHRLSDLAPDLLASVLLFLMANRKAK